MAVALHSYKIDKDGKIRVEHIFYADTEDAADQLMTGHAEGCQAFGPAVDAGRTIEVLDEDAEVPTVEDLEADDDDGDEDEGEEAEADDAE
jgi:hypothetical protein